MLKIYLLIVTVSVLCSFGNLCSELKIGLIGLDTSHVIKFTEIINDVNAVAPFSEAKIVGLFKGGSPDIESSASRVDKYTETLNQEFKIKLYSSIEELCLNVDAILLTSLDGRKHLEQVKSVFEAGKPVFIDKPLAGSLDDAIAIYNLSKKYKTPFMSCSSFRYIPEIENLNKHKKESFHTVVSHGPMTIEPTHPDLYFYAVHPTESLFTLMGGHCKSVTRTIGDHTEVITGSWDNERIGLLIAHKEGKAKYQYQVETFENEKHEIVKLKSDYKPMLAVILDFFKTGVSPIAPEHTLEIMAFMEAADESKRKGGVPVALEELFQKRNFKLYSENQK